MQGPLLCTSSDERPLSVGNTHQQELQRITTQPWKPFATPEKEGMRDKRERVIQNTSTPTLLLKKRHFQLVKQGFESEVSFYSGTLSSPSSCCPVCRWWQLSFLWLRRGWSHGSRRTPSILHSPLFFCRFAASHQPCSSLTWACP